MYEPNDLDLWRQRRDEILREVEQVHLARVLKAERSSKARYRSRVSGYARTLIRPAFLAEYSGR